MSLFKTALAAGDAAILIIVTLIAVYAGWKLFDEVSAIARVVKQTYVDSAWTRAGIRWRETGRKEIEWERDVSSRTREDVELAKYGAIALGVVFAGVVLGVLLFAGDVWLALNAPAPTPK